MVKSPLRFLADRSQGKYRESTDIKKGSYLIGYSLKPKLFVIGRRYIFDFVTLRHLQAKILFCLHKLPWH